MPTLFVVIPFFNEEATLRPCVERIVGAELPAGWSKHLVLVDDRSRDGTGVEAEAIVRDHVPEAERPTAFWLHRHRRNRGKGAALKTGFRMILESDAAEDDLVIIQDADLEYDPSDYAALVEPWAKAGDAGERPGAVYGTRWGGHRSVRGLWRRLHEAGNRFLTTYSNLMTGLRVRDMECCYKVMPVRVVREVLPQLSEDRFGIEPQITAALSRLGIEPLNVPVRYEPRGSEAGKKIGWRDFSRAMWVITRERLRRVDLAQVKARAAAQAREPRPSGGADAETLPGLGAEPGERARG